MQSYSLGCRNDTRKPGNGASLRIWPRTENSPTCIAIAHSSIYLLWFLGCRLYEAYIRCFSGFLTAFYQGSSESPWKRDHSGTMGIRTSVTLAGFDVVLAMHKYADSDRLYGWIFDQNSSGIDPMSQITAEMKFPDLKDLNICVTPDCVGYMHKVVILVDRFDKYSRIVYRRLTE